MELRLVANRIRAFRRAVAPIVVIAAVASAIGKPRGLGRSGRFTGQPPAGFANYTDPSGFTLQKPRLAGRRDEA